jgi:hypothetical protein
MSPNCTPPPPTVHFCALPLLPTLQPLHFTSCPPNPPASAPLQVRATGGDTRLGGEDFDAATTKFLETQFLRTHPNCTVDARGRRRLIAAAERAKRHLSSQTTAEVRAAFVSRRGCLFSSAKRQLSSQTTAEVRAPFSFPV